MRSSILWLVVAACGGGQARVDVEPRTGMNVAALDACARGDLAQQLAIVNELRDSYHEMIVCGGLALDFNTAVVSVLVDAALGSKSPRTVEYRGNGVYESANRMMLLRTFRADGTPFDAPVLALDSYVVGGKVTADLTAVARAVQSKDKLGNKLDALADVELDVQLAGEGPLFALLGATPAAGRFKITPKQAAAALGSQIGVANRIDVKDVHGGTEVHYLLDGKPALVKSVLGPKAVPMELTSIEARRAGTGQTIRVTEWTMQFEGDGGRVLDGTIGVDVDGGAFPYHARFSYARSAEPSIELRCR